MDFSECYGDTVSSVAAAARRGCRKRLRRLIERGLGVEGWDNRGWTALHEAAAAGSEGCVQEIVSAAGGKRAEGREALHPLAVFFMSLCVLRQQAPPPAAAPS